MTLPALLFDLDGTLVDSAAGIAAALSIVLRDRGGAPIPVERVRPLVSQGADVLVATALGAFAQNPADDLAAFRNILRDLHPDPAMIYDGVIDALTRLSARGHAMAIVTNKPEGLARTLLDGLDLMRFFPVIVGGDTTALPKPDRAPIDHALLALAARHADAVLIGDSEVDAEAADASSIPFVLFEGGYGADRCAPQHIAARFSGFTDLDRAIEVTLAVRPISER